MPVSLDDLLSMAVFARVVEMKSFTAAAGKLGLAKSALSTRVARLEDHLGARLLHRTTRRLTLTEAGVAFYERCARVVAAADDAAHVAAGVSAAPRGTVRVSAPSAFAQMYLPLVLMDFLQTHPDVRVELSLEDRVVDVMGEEADVAIRVAKVPLRGAGLMARKLASDHTVVCGSPSYFERMGRPTTPQDLLHHNCLRYSHMRARDQWRFRGSGGELSVPVNGSFAANEGAVLRNAAVAGLGLVVLPSFMVAPDLAGHRLETVLDEFVSTDVGIYAVHAHRRHVPAAIRALVDFLAARFRGVRWERAAFSH